MENNFQYYFNYSTFFNLQIRSKMNCVISSWTDSVYFDNILMNNEFSNFENDSPTVSIISNPMSYLHFLFVRPAGNRWDSFHSIFNQSPNSLFQHESMTTPIPVSFENYNDDISPYQFDYLPQPYDSMASL